jgi:hypothetical protein
MSFKLTFRLWILDRKLQDRLPHIFVNVVVVDRENIEGFLLVSRHAFFSSKTNVDSQFKCVIHHSRDEHFQNGARLVVARVSIHFN